MNDRTARTARLEVDVDERAEQPEWDRFVAGAPSGHHVQTTMWGRVKASMGWSAIRVIARRDGQIVGGAQVLHRPLTRIGRIGYVSHGPLVTDPSVATAIHDRLEWLARELRILHLTMQAPLPAPGLPEPTPRPHHMVRTSAIAAPATTIVDLDATPDELLAGMQRKTRYNIRLSERRGVKVRTGTVDDLGLYHAMVEATAKRRRFDPFPQAYYQAMWDELHPGGHLRLAVAELDGDPLAAQIAIGFGTTVVNKLSVWSGSQGRARPNEAIQWSAIEHSHAHGYLSYDLEGIEIEAARHLLAGEDLPPKFDQTTTSFKLGFGGRVVIAPPAFEYVANPAVRWAYRELYPRVSTRRWVKRLRKRLRTKET